ncbi:MAG TPA: UDP-N-acetylmuramate--L-alanine ligase [Candidatus Krumholzibacteria bacterium]|nr:UDP-N-acetylmuramate--L-alanine ligase [Candidatus Krumholzibacteria bacterium]
MFGRVKRVHFVGVGGIGMSGIAEVLLNLDFTVSGSDIKESSVTRRLASRGARIAIGHRAQNLEDAQVVVYSSAVRPDNPELVAAREQKLPVIPRAEMLGELMRLKFAIAVAGAHGKTTTTSMVATLLAEAGLDPTIVVGGRVLALGTHAMLGGGQYLVAEADESDGSFLRLPPTIAIITNIDAEHLDHYKNIEAILDAFVQFANKVPFYGSTIVCLDDPLVQSIIPRLEKRIVTYGLATQADITGRVLATADGGSRFEVSSHGVRLGEVALRMPGEHNVLNALATVALAQELQIPFATTASGLAAFLGVARRFEIKAVENEVVFVDDYGHHPTEIAATLRAAKHSHGRRLLVVFQPHRYTRTQFLLNEFGRAFFDADSVYVMDIYAASEDPIPGVDSSRLVQALREHGHKRAFYIGDKDQLTDQVASSIEKGDLVLTLGAGDVTALNEVLVEKYRRRIEAEPA